ncbi:hypothetical protein P175DRAFT_0156812 [Aspergillus ochraceoroseus IBT 24754]|uniref:Uncharacterized protein n=1 Tax=Aspergillus ochraceoroseus IBT 24754 TaxID=1392256 RepID=A0A2T5M3I2_9EURO|nr:uncharacterized protein P175DRAFT_0156812 [Aspergillus ochraceoroseus IBT 24754]PTU23076.1 hypothetical protein P175DRAFT_0156812 [Aspergillus ochraceoroseus IBT 24754]
MMFFLLPIFTFLYLDPCNRLDQFIRADDSCLSISELLFIVRDTVDRVITDKITNLFVATVYTMIYSYLFLFISSFLEICTDMVTVNLSLEPCREGKGTHKVCNRFALLRIVQRFKVYY